MLICTVVVSIATGFLTGWRYAFGVLLVVSPLTFAGFVTVLLLHDWTLVRVGLACALLLVVQQAAYVVGVYARTLSHAKRPRDLPQPRLDPLKERDGGAG